MACEHCGEEVAKKEAPKKKGSSKKKGFIKTYLINMLFWKGVLLSMVHMAGAVLVLHDLGIILLHSFFPKVLEHSGPIFLDKILHTLASVFSGMPM